MCLGEIKGNILFQKIIICDSEVLFHVSGLLVYLENSFFFFNSNVFTDTNIVKSKKSNFTD